MMKAVIIALSALLVVGCATSGPTSPQGGPYTVVDLRTNERISCEIVHIWQGTLYCGISTDIAFPPGTWHVENCDWCDRAKAGNP